MNSKTSAKVFIFFISLIGIIMGYSAIYVLPEMAKHSSAIYEEGKYIANFIVYYVWITAIPFYLTLYQAIKICNYIIKDKIFSKDPLKSFGKITIFSLIILVMYLLLLIALYVIRFFPQTMVLVLFLVIFSCTSIALISQIMKLLLLRAIELKEENDLTIWGVLWLLLI